MKEIEVIFRESQPTLSHLKFPYVPVIMDYSISQVPTIYDLGFVAFGDFFKMARSVRIDLNSFNLNSENRRLIRKVSTLQPQVDISKKQKVPYIRYEEFIKTCIEFSKKTLCL